MPLKWPEQAGWVSAFDGRDLPTKRLPAEYHGRMLGRLQSVPAERERTTGTKSALGFD